MPKRQAARLGVRVLILLLWPALLFPQDHISRVDELFSRWDTTETPGCGLANLDALNPTDLCFRIAEIYLGHLMQEPASPDATALPEQTAATGNVLPPEDLKRFAGEYVNEEAWQRAVVTFENDELRIQPHPFYPGQKRGYHRIQNKCRPRAQPPLRQIRGLNVLDVRVPADLRVYSA